MSPPQIEQQRNQPNEGLIHTLLTAEVDGQHLTDDEVVANTIIILIGGHETTTSLIAGGFLTLLQRPNAYEQPRTHPEIIASAVEELLRFESPSQSTARVAPADMQLGGKSIKKGARIVAGLAAANRDPNRFPDQDRLDLERGDNRHVPFGWAAHFCFGAPLARSEGQIAFNKLLGRLSRPKLLEENSHGARMWVFAA
jgi:cytochrome P450